MSPTQGTSQSAAGSESNEATREGVRASDSVLKSDATPPAAEKKKTSVKLRVLWPEIWKMVRPRRWLLLLGLVLMAINRVAGLVLPWSTKSLIDDVINKHQQQKLVPIITGVILATIIQGITSFSLTQLLSKAAQRLIA